MAALAAAHPPQADLQVGGPRETMAMALILEYV
jgi:hypothetical protein